MSKSKRSRKTLWANGERLGFKREAAPFSGERFFIPPLASLEYLQACDYFRNLFVWTYQKGFKLEDGYIRKLCELDYRSAKVEPDSLGLDDFEHIDYIFVVDSGKNILKMKKGDRVDPAKIDPVAVLAASMQSSAKWEADLRAAILEEQKLEAEDLGIEADDLLDEEEIDISIEINIDPNCRWTDHALIRRVVVHPDYRRRGIGTFLMQFAMRTIANMESTLTHFTARADASDVEAARWCFNNGFKFHSQVNKEHYYEGRLHLAGERFNPIVTVKYLDRAGAIVGRYC